jgi:hypothetical protein
MEKILRQRKFQTIELNSKGKERKGKERKGKEREENEYPACSPKRENG